MIIPVKSCTYAPIVSLNYTDFDRSDKYTMDETPKDSDNDVLSPGSETHVSGPRSYTTAANTNVASLPSSPHVSRPSTSMMLSMNAQDEHQSTLQNFSMRWCYCRLPDDANKSAATNIPTKVDREHDPTFNVGKVNLTQKSRNTPPAGSGPVRRVDHGKEDEAQHSIMPRVVQPSVSVTAHLPEYCYPESYLKYSDDIYQRSHQRTMPILMNRIPDRQPATDEQRIDARALLTPSLQFRSAEWKTPELTEKYHEAASRPATGCTKTIIDDYALRTDPSYDGHSDEMANPVPRCIKTTTTERSAYTTTASTPTSTTQESSNPEDVADTTNSIEAQGPGGRFWTPGEHSMVVDCRSKNENWETIAEKMPGRTAEDCRRYIEEPRSRGMPGTGSHPHWTSDEENIVHVLRRQGKTWHQIAEALPARSAGGCRTRWKEKFAPKKEKKRAWWQIAYEARVELTQDRSGHGQRSTRPHRVVQKRVMRVPPRKDPEDAGENSQRRASTFQTAMHGHSSGSIVESFPQRSLASATEGTGAQGPYYQSPREGLLNARHVAQTLFIPPPWSPAHVDYGIDPSSYGVQVSDMVPYPYQQTGCEQQSMNQVPSLDSTRDLSRVSTTSPHSYELPRPHNDSVFEQRDSNLADDADVDMSSSTYDVESHQRQRMLSIQSLCAPDGDSVSSEYWSPGGGQMSRSDRGQKSAAFTARNASDFTKQA